MTTGGGFEKFAGIIMAGRAGYCAAFDAHAMPLAPGGVTNRGGKMQRGDSEAAETDEEEGILSAGGMAMPAGRSNFWTLWRGDVFSII